MSPSRLLVIAALSGVLAGCGASVPLSSQPSLSFAAKRKDGSFIAKLREGRAREFRHHDKNRNSMLERPETKHLDDSVFAAYDRDHDGSVSDAEWHLETYYVEFIPKIRAYGDKWVDYIDKKWPWSKPDGVITRKQFMESPFAGKVQPWTAVPRWTSHYKAWFFDEADTNDDAQLDKTEFFGLMGLLFEQGFDIGKGKWWEEAPRFQLPWG